MFARMPERMSQASHIDIIPTLGLEVYTYIYMYVYTCMYTYSFAQDLYFGLFGVLGMSPQVAIILALPLLTGDPMQDAGLHWLQGASARPPAGSAKSLHESRSVRKVVKSSIQVSESLRRELCISLNKGD